MGEVTTFDLNNVARQLSRQIEGVGSMVTAVGNEVNAVSAKVNVVDNELADLKQRFEAMVEEQRKTAILQKAATELIRVRQELEQKYSNYEVVRNTMIGVLQATDLALVKQTTISRVSEELMLSTPKYWLAPCLVAVAAWIGNDKDLAERAIKEAVKRDEERTALTMALICRRNGRTDTCYEWLSLYFSKQTMSSFSEGSFVYLNAYINGVFGPDTKNICSDYLSKWLSDVKGGNENFEADQKKIWAEFCQGFTCNLAVQYPNLARSVVEFGRINDYLGRVEGATRITQEITSIEGANVDLNKIKDTIDENLLNLVRRYNEDEMPLRNEERYLKLVRKFDGDEYRARKQIEVEEAERRQQTVNIVEQMTNAIIKGNSSASEKKTAVSILKPYIQGGYENYIEEKKGAFPNVITVKVGDWQGRTDGTNENELKGQYNAYLSDHYNRDAEYASKSQKTTWMIAAIVTGVIGIALTFVSPILLVIALGLAGFFVYKMVNDGKEVEKRMSDLNTRYSQMSASGFEEISQCVNQWNAAKSKAAEFEGNPNYKKVS